LPRPIAESWRPWSILTGHEPLLVLPFSEDDAIREAAETIARRMAPLR
jgi:hypothetical protein